MKAPHYLLSTILIASTAFLAACGGGGGVGKTNEEGEYLTYWEVTNEFLKDMRLHGYNVQMAKWNTDQFNYAVLYDASKGSYTAYDLSHYDVDGYLSVYLSAYKDDFYYNLTPMGDGTYKDMPSGIVFEETTPSSKDLEKMSALVQGIQIQNATDRLVAEYGLSAERANEVARLATQLANAPQNSMTDADYDNFSKELLGSSITQFMNALRKQSKGDSSEMANLLETAAEVNGVGPEHMTKIVEKIFSQRN